MYSNQFCDREGRPRPDCQGTALSTPVLLSAHRQVWKRRQDFVPQGHSEGMAVTFRFSRLWRRIGLWVRGQSWLRTEVFPKENLSYHAVKKMVQQNMWIALQGRWNTEAMQWLKTFNLISYTGGVLSITKVMTCGSGGWILDSSSHFSRTHHLKPSALDFVQTVSWSWHKKRVICRTQNILVGSS